MNSCVYNNIYIITIVIAYYTNCDNNAIIMTVGLFYLVY